MNDILNKIDLFLTEGIAKPKNKEIEKILKEIEKIATSFLHSEFSNQGLESVFSKAADGEFLSKDDAENIKNKIIKELEKIKNLKELGITYKILVYDEKNYGNGGYDKTEHPILWTVRLIVTFPGKSTSSKKSKMSYYD